MASKADRRAAHRERVERRKLQGKRRELSEDEKRVIAEQLSKEAGTPIGYYKYAYVDASGQMVGFYALEPV